MKMLKPRPLQLVQIEPLFLVNRWTGWDSELVCGLLIGVGMVIAWVGLYAYLGAFPAQLLHVNTVRPPTQEMCCGSRFRRESIELVILG
jgi:hypothetical protein